MLRSPLAKLLLALMALSWTPVAPFPKMDVCTVLVPALFPEALIVLNCDPAAILPEIEAREVIVPALFPAILKELDWVEGTGAAEAREKRRETIEII
jgi:hypothetical protein